MHLLHPAPYLAMMPPWLPVPEALVWWSGLAEIAGGLGVLLSQTRILSGWGLIALVIAVFPANLQVALHGWPGYHVPPAILWLRLPLQPLIVWWIHHATLRSRRAALP